MLDGMATTPAVRSARRSVDLPGLAPALGVGVAGLLALVALGTTAALLPRMAAGQSLTDLTIFRASAAAWRAGGDPYAPVPWPNLNHPAFLLLTAPFSAMSFSAAYATWAVATIAAYTLGLLLCARVARPVLAGWRGATAVALAASCPGLLASILWGQVGVFLGLGTVAVWLLLRRDRALAAGVVAGVLIACKPYLLPLAAVFLARERRRGLGGVALGAAGLSILALPFVGWRAYLGWGRALTRVVDGGGSPSISLVGFLAHALGRTPPALIVVALQAGMVLAVAALVVARPSRGVPGGDRDVSAALLLALLGSPLGWVHYLATLLPVGATLLRRRHRLDALEAAVAVAATVVLWLPGALGAAGLPVDMGQTAALLALLSVTLTVRRAPARYHRAGSVS